MKSALPCHPFKHSTQMCVWLKMGRCMCRRYDGLDQRQVIKELEEAVDEMGNNPATFKAKSANLLSPFETIQHRAHDLSTWFPPFRHHPYPVSAWSSCLIT